MYALGNLQTVNNNDSILKAYALDRRDYEIPNYRREDLGTVVRYTPQRADADGIVCFATIRESDLDREIESLCDYFKEKSLGFEWKVYDFDTPSTLVQRLKGRGFEQGETEALMVYDLQDSPPLKIKVLDGIEIREVSSGKDLEEIVRIQETVWNRSFPWLHSQLLSTKDRNTYFIAFHRSIPIGTAWIEQPAESPFSELHGGSVCAEYRGRGIYSELYRIRIEHARKTKTSYIAVDAAPMSKPILLKKGFKELCSTYPLTMKNNK